jgi:hypothetical protein
MTSAKLSVPAGRDDQASGGTASPPSHVYGRGIGAPSANAGLVSVKVM